MAEENTIPEKQQEFYKATVRCQPLPDATKDIDQKGGIEKIKLTPQEVENWRRILFGVIGEYVLTMSAEDIQACRDRMQEEAGEKEFNYEKNTGT